jgi:glutamate dehydrogenase/leucine dehydrogenase
MAASEKTTFNAAAAITSKVVVEAAAMPVIPREIEDILTMKTSERHRWLADGRLPSAGARTVRLNERARQITFHVFDPKVVEDLLDRGAVEEWREEEEEAKAEKRQRAAYQAKLTRALKKETEKRSKRASDSSKSEAPKLGGWEEFDADGLLR